MIVEFNGGLGNQMFQYAIYKRMCLEYPNLNVLVDLTKYKESSLEIESVFENIKLDRCTIEESARLGKTYRYLPNRIRNRFLISGEIYGLNIITEKNIHRKTIKDNTYFKGYWQSETFFSNITNELRADFIFNVNDETNIEMMNKIVSCNAVSLHVRRGDYLSNSNPNYFINLSVTKYYENAIKYIKKRIESPVFFVFSDDIDWCRKNFVGEEFVFVDANNGYNNWKDMYLMGGCKANIIANSSFSWWGAYLSNNNIIIAPNYIGKRFEKDHPDYYPDGWIRVPIQ